MTRIEAQPLTPAAFAPFGQVIARRAGGGRGANQGTATRFDFAADLVNLRPHARANLAVFCSVARTPPVTIRLFERHPCSSQAFMRLDGGRMIVVVAPPSAEGSPDVAAAVAFVVPPGAGINYAPGVWHHPIVAPDRDAELAMLAWEDGGAEDCVEFALDPPIEIVWAGEVAASQAWPTSEPHAGRLDESSVI